MLDFFESLPLPAATAIVAGVAVLITWGLSTRLPNVLLWIAGVAVPLIVSYCAYWVPTWIRTSTDLADYSAFALVAIAIWSFWGIVACLLLVALLSRRRNPRRRMGR
jgi:hypothetical protein